MKDKIFLIDFDKTISLKDSTDELMKIHNKDLLEEYHSLFRKGKLRVRDYLKGLVESLDIDEKKYSEDVIKNLKLDPYFKDFLNLGYEIRIVSAGAYENIIPNFKKNNINIPLEHIYSNKINFTKNGIKVTFPHDTNEAVEGICKKCIIEKYKKHYKKVIFIGDGSSDIPCAESADILFAKKHLSLESYCEQKKIPHYKYNNFKEIIDIIKEKNI